MAVQGTPPKTDDPTARLEQMHAKNMADSAKMQEFQMKVNADNTRTTALSTLIKGNDDVLRAIANSLK